LLLALFATIVNFLFPTSRPRNTGGFLAHLGLIVFLLGVLLTFSNSRIISANTSSYDLGDSRSNSENLLLMRQDTLYMGGYYVVYTDAVKRVNTTTYQVDFLKYKDGRFIHRFSLFPSINVHPRMGAVYNPATRRFLMRDIYTYIAVANGEPDYIVIKAIMNPFINILWFGALLMTAGLAYSTLKRIRKL
jgi:cytochrome c biogenesis factor